MTDIVEQREEEITSTRKRSYRNFLFTINNPTDGDRTSLTSIAEAADFKYMCFQDERGSAEGTLHVQGYVEFSKPKSFAFIRNLLPRAYLAKRRGTADQARMYCSSTHYCRTHNTNACGCPAMEAKGQVPDSKVEVGMFFTQGTRTDLFHARDIIKEGGLTLLAEKAPDIAFKYAAGAALMDNLLNRFTLDKFELTLAPWQVELHSILTGPVQKRSIYWVWSAESSQGKSTFANWLAAELGSDKFLRGCTRMMDTLYLYKRHSVIWFDLPRQTPVDADFTSQIEALSDLRDHISTKYQCCVKVVKAHVVVSCNRDPDALTYSKDGSERQTVRQKLPNRIIPIHAQLDSSVAPSSPVVVSGDNYSSPHRPPNSTTGFY